MVATFEVIPAIRIRKKQYKLYNMCYVVYNQLWTNAFPCIDENKQQIL